MPLSNSTDRFNGVLASLAIKAPCVVATLADITLSGEQTINTVDVVSGDRVLVVAQTNAVENGIYDVNVSGWTRAADWDGNRDATERSLIFTGGPVSDANLFWQCTTSGNIVIGSTEVNFEIWFNPDAVIVPGLVLANIPTATPPTTEAVEGVYLIRDLDNDDDLMEVGFVGANTLILRNYMEAGLILLQGKHVSGGGFSRIVRGDPDGILQLFFNDQENLRVVDESAAGIGMGAEVRHNNDSFYPVGMNVLPPDPSLDSGNVTLSQGQVGDMLTYDNSNARSLFFTDDSDIKDGATWGLIVGPNAGVLTGDGGTGVVIRWWNGVDWTDTAAAGDITIEEGQYSIWMESSTLYVIVGPNIMAV